MHGGGRRMGEPGRPHCLGRGCEGTPVGAAHSIRPRWEATWPGSKPGTTGSLWDRLGDLVLSILALLSLTPQAPGTHMVAGDCLVADGQTAIINVTVFAGRPWAQIQPPQHTHLGEASQICCPLPSTPSSPGSSAPGPCG